MQRVLTRLLYLETGELGRLTPFFLLYFLLFTGLSLADGLSLTLFLGSLGREYLPTAYASVGFANLFIMAGYIFLAERLGSVRTFFIIIVAASALLTSCWIAIAGPEPSWIWFSLLFSGREIIFSLVLMHFGTLFQDFFSRDEMNRGIPIVYSGGRVGGILGGWMLQHLAEPVGLINLIGVTLALLSAGFALLVWVSVSLPRADKSADHLGDPGVKPARQFGGRDSEVWARESLWGFLAYVWASPLLFWSTVTMVLFQMCRWILSFQYSSFFATHFDNELALAEFLGAYTQWALAGSLIVQVLLVNRMIAWLGIKGTYLVYSGLMLAATSVLVLPMTLGLAVFARAVETELRFGLRNPITMLITNKFSKLLRIRVRAWNMGILVPLATLGSSALLGGFVQGNAAGSIPYLGGVCGLVYFITSFGLIGSFDEKKPEKKGDDSQVPK